MSSSCQTVEQMTNFRFKAPSISLSEKSEDAKSVDQIEANVNVDECCRLLNDHKSVQQILG